MSKQSTQGLTRVKSTWTSNETVKHWGSVCERCPKINLKYAKYTCILSVPKDAREIKDKSILVPPLMKAI